MAFNYAPRGWAFANGQLLPINQNQALFSLCGTTYGGNGATTFALPDLRGRVPLHTGPNHPQGTAVGEQTHTLTLSEMPAHTHLINASNQTANLTAPDLDMQFAKYEGDPNDPNQKDERYFLAGSANLQAMNPNNVSSVGEGQPHQNMQPFLVLNFCIALQGIWPSRN